MCFVDTWSDWGLPVTDTCFNEGCMQVLYAHDHRCLSHSTNLIEALIRHVGQARCDVTEEVVGIVDAVQVEVRMTQTPLARTTLVLR